MTTRHRTDRRRRSRAIRSGLAALYGAGLVERWAGRTPPNAVRAKAQEHIDWEQVSFAGETPTTLSERLGCHRRTVTRARRRLHIPEPPPMTTKDRAKMVERIDWEQVSFAGKSRRQVAEEQGCKYRTAQLAARRLHIPLEKVPPRRPKKHSRGAPVGNQNARKCPRHHKANGLCGAQALETRRRADRAQRAQEQKAA